MAASIIVNFYSGGEHSDVLNVTDYKATTNPTNSTNVVTNAKSQDTVNLYDVNLTDITSINYVGNAIKIGLNSGGNLQVNSAEGISSKFMLADGSNWQFNHSTKNWQQA